MTAEGVRRFGVGTILSQRSRISLGKFFVIFWLELCLRSFEFTWVIFIIFWSTSLHEAYIDGLMRRWQLKSCDDVDVGTILSQRSRIYLGNFFRYLLVGTLS